MGGRLIRILSACRRLASGMALLGLAMLAMMLASPSRAAGGGDAVKVRFGGDQAETRLVVESARPLQAKLGDQDAHSLEFALAGLKLPSDLTGSGRGLVQAWSLKRSAGGATLTLTLTRKTSISRRFLLPPADGIDVYRYVVDLTGDGVASAQPVAAIPVKTTQVKAVPGKVAAVAAPASKSEVSAGRTLADFVQAAQTLKARLIRKVVVIDAGHGGHDPGALGDKAREKDITLAAAKMLKSRLERTGRFKVVLTRDRDVFVPLEDRVQIARKANADLFISLHADVGADPAVHGATVYTLSDQGVDRAAKGVFDGGSFLNVKLPGRDQSVKQILLDLTQRNTRNRSGAFAQTLIDEVSGQTDLVSRSHRDAGYVVLLAPDVPAVLLEMGFITNRHDENQLTDPVRRGRLMNAVGAAIETYFADGGPDEPKLALR